MTYLDDEVWQVDLITPSQRISVFVGENWEHAKFYMDNNPIPESLKNERFLNPAPVRWYKDIGYLTIPIGG